MSTKKTGVVMPADSCNSNVRKQANSHHCYLEALLALRIGAV